MKLMDFSDWITQKYVEWRGSAIGNSRSITQFSAWIGVSQQLMSEWMKQSGKVPKHKKTIDRLVNRFGIEVYDVLGIPDKDRRFILLDQLPSSLRSRIEAAMNEINTRFEEEEVDDPESTEAERIAVEVMAKYGLKF